MSQLEVDKIIPSSGTTINIGDSGDTVNISDGTALTVDTNTLAIDQANNRVGIGTSSPDNKLHIQNGDASASSNSFSNLTVEGNSSYNILQFLSPNTASQQIRFGDPQDDGAGYIQFNHSDSSMSFGLPSERMRIDSSGNVLIGQTSASTSDDGHYFQSTGTAIHVANSNRSLDLYRLSDNGDTLQMYQGSTICGRIGTISGNAIYINAPNNGGGGFLFSDNASTIYPTRRTSGTVSLSDNTNDLGAQVWRFNDAYITNGVTTGSDQNEKQQIQLLTDSEIAVAKRISKGFKTFKWNSAVEEKGDNARIHTGVIAQDVQQAFADEGLDAGNYAFFMSNTYWEKEISVDAVAEELDEEGNVIVEGKDAYTYIDKKEEATEGYTERTRLGIRYPELLSFVSSAFEQRLTNIETRLTALET